MDRTQCGGCGLYNFSDVVECKRCGRSLSAEVSTGGTMFDPERHAREAAERGRHRATSASAVKPDAAGMAAKVALVAAVVVGGYYAFNWATSSAAEKFEPPVPSKTGLGVPLAVADEIRATETDEKGNTPLGAAPMVQEMKNATPPAGQNAISRAELDERIRKAEKAGRAMAGPPAPRPPNPARPQSMRADGN